MTNQEETFLLTLRKVAMSCPDKKLRKEIRNLADGMEIIIRDLYHCPTEDMLRALNCLYSYSVRLSSIAGENQPPTGGGRAPLPIPSIIEEPRAATN